MKGIVKRGMLQPNLLDDAGEKMKKILITIGLILFLLIFVSILALGRYTFINEDANLVSRCDRITGHCVLLRSVY